MVHTDLSENEMRVHVHMYIQVVGGYNYYGHSLSDMNKVFMYIIRRLAKDRLRGGKPKQMIFLR